MFSKTIIAVLLASSAVFAAPVETSTKEVEERQINQSVTLCSDKGMADCDTVNFNFGFCGLFYIYPSRELPTNILQSLLSEDLTIRSARWMPMFLTASSTSK